MFANGNRLIVVGYGNMGKAVVDGLGHHKAIHASSVTVVDPGDNARLLSSQRGMGYANDASQLQGVQPGDVVLLAVKPQVFGSVAPGLAAALKGVGSPGVLVLSVMAGVPSQAIEAALGDGPSVRVIRAMPNMAAENLQSTTAIAVGKTATNKDGVFALQFFKSVGIVVLIEEPMMDAFTAVAGSGPAYVFHLAEAMVAGAIAAGFSPHTADVIVRQTIRGAAEVLSGDSITPPAEFRTRVTSKGGTTEAALNVLTQRGTHDAMVAAILAARDRGRELGR